MREGRGGEGEERGQGGEGGEEGRVEEGRAVKWREGEGRAGQ